MPSNVENILNAILTGDGSGIQKPASRVEELLFEIYEQGGGGGDSVIGGIKLTIDSNYVMTATLVDKDGEEYGVSDDIDLPLEEMVVDAEYDPQTQKIKLELKNGNYVEFSVAELVSGLQTELSSSNKLNPAYIDYDASHRVVSDTEKDTWNAKQNAISDLDTIRSGATSGATAVQPSEMQTALSAKQDTISDLAAIRSGATAGATAVQPETMSTALALKQDSLDNTQLAAVNSGINSTKVAQIETNKTNILSVIEHGQKNQLNFDGWSTHGVGVTWKLNDDNTITATGTASNENYIILQLNGVNVNIDNLCDGLHFLSGCPAGGDFASKYAVYATKGSYLSLDTGSGVVLSDTSESGVMVIIGIAEGFAIPSGGLVFSPMICLKSVYDVYPDYQPYALPNYDLTRLEAEDRAALAEVVDESAKNIFDITTPDSLRDTTVTPLENGGAKLSCNNATWTQYRKSISTKTGEKYKVAVYIDSITGSIGSDLGIYVKRENAQDDDPYFELHPTSTGVYTADLTALTSVTTISIYINNSGTSKTLDVNMRVMVCSEADWKISQNYAPYRKNLDQLEATKAPALSTITMDSGSLDDITTNSFIVCSWEVAGKPISTMGFVRTSVFDANSALQEFYSFSADETQSGLVYVRDKQAGVWRSWKLLTNNT